MHNEASVVHCFDEGNRKALKKTSLGKDQSSVSERTLAGLAKKRQFAEFRVPRDSPTFGFVAVGDPPMPEELGEGTWLPPQTAELSLPSGLLRMETALSFSLGPEIPEDDGTFVEVPPGDYRLTFVVAESAPADRPRIFLTLTPATAPDAPIEVRIRPAPPPLPKNSKLSKYTVEEGRFSGWRRGGITNLDRRAAEQMKLKFGERLRLAGKSGAQEAWFLGAFSNSTRSLTEADFLAVSNSGAGHRQELFAAWVSDADIPNWLVLSVFRFVAPADYPQPEPPPFFWLEQKQRQAQGQPPLESPRLTLAELAEQADRIPLHIHAPMPSRAEPVEVTVLPDRFPLGAAGLDGWSLRDGALLARVLTWSPSVITLNVGPNELRQLGIIEGGFMLELAGQTRHALLLSRRERERPGSAASNFRGRHYTLHDELPQWLAQVKAARNLPDDLVFPLAPDGTLRIDAVRFAEWEGGELVKMASRHAKTIQEAAARGTPLVLSLPAIHDPPPLCALGVPHWGESRREILWLESGAYRRDYSRKAMWDNVLPHGLPELAGAPIVLRPCPPS